MFGSQAYTDAASIYAAIINDPTNPVPTLPGSPILILDSTFNLFEVMSNPLLATNDLTW